MEKLTKKEARELLADYLSSKCEYDGRDGQIRSEKLPINDEIVYDKTIRYGDKSQTITYTFKYLLKIAYDL